MKQIKTLLLNIQMSYYRLRIRGYWRDIGNEMRMRGILEVIFGIFFFVVLFYGLEKIPGGLLSLLSIPFMILLILCAGVAEYSISKFLKFFYLNEEVEHVLKEKILWTEKQLIGNQVTVSNKKKMSVGGRKNKI